jgi:hypothetical protein
LDILMISLVPLGVFLIMLVGLATFWRWDSPTDKGWVVAIAVASFAVVGSGWLLYRFGWNEMSWLLVGALAVIPVSSFFFTKWVQEFYVSMRGRNPGPPSVKPADLRTAAPFLVPMVTVIVVGSALYLWATSR